MKLYDILLSKINCFSCIYLCFYLFNKWSFKLSDIHVVHFKISWFTFFYTPTMAKMHILFLKLNKLTLDAFLKHSILFYMYPLSAMKSRRNGTEVELRVGETGVGEMGVGETGQIIGETGVSEMGVNPFSIYAFCHVCKNIPCELGLIHIQNI